jgi:hypothetical protein
MFVIIIAIEAWQKRQQRWGHRTVLVVPIAHQCMSTGARTFTPLVFHGGGAGAAAGSWVSEPYSTRSLYK